MRIFKRHTSIWEDALLGALAGGVATTIMGPAMARLQSMERPKAKEIEKKVGPSEHPPAQVAGKVAAFAGIPLSKAQREKGGTLVHYGYGMFWGAVFGVLHPRVKIPGILHGLVFGTALALLSEAVILPAFKLAPPPQRYPVDTHLAGWAAHLLYGASAERSFSLMKRALA